MRSRYLALSLLVVALLAARSVGGQWAGDYWEHAAVVRELARAPFSPSHPQLPGDAPHAFFSPYLLGLALVARAGGLDPFAALALAGMANLLVLLAALRWLVAELFPERDADGLACYALLFTLLLWGLDPWGWSGFLHLGILGRVLPYPSTAAAGWLFLALAVQLRWLHTHRARWLAALAVLASAILLTHPTTAATLGVGLVALCLGRGGTSWWRVLPGPAAALACALAAASAWPYFPFFELLREQTPQFHLHSRHLYEQVVPRSFPALAALPLLALRARADRRDPLVWTFAGLAALYAAGFASGRFGLGRVLAYAIFVLQLCAADAALRLEKRGRAGDRRARLALAALALAVLALAWAPLRRVAREIVARPGSAAAYAFVEREVEPGAVVLSDLTTSLRLPAFGAKIVVAKHPIHFLADPERRREDVRRFFADGASGAERRAILQRYGVRYLLLDRERLRVAPETWRELVALGAPVRVAGPLTLVRVGPARAAAPPAGTAGEQ